MDRLPKIGGTSDTDNKFAGGKVMPSLGDKFKELTNPEEIYDVQFMGYYISDDIMADGVITTRELYSKLCWYRDLSFGNPEKIFFSKLLLGEAVASKMGSMYAQFLNASVNMRQHTTIAPEVLRILANPTSMEKETSVWADVGFDNCVAYINICQWLLQAAPLLKQRVGQVNEGNYGTLDLMGHSLPYYWAYGPELVNRVTLHYLNGYTNADSFGSVRDAAYWYVSKFYDETYKAWSSPLSELIRSKDRGYEFYTFCNHEVDTLVHEYTLDYIKTGNRHIEDLARYMDSSRFKLSGGSLSNELEYITGKINSCPMRWDHTLTLPTVAMRLDLEGKFGYTPEFLSCYGEEILKIYDKIPDITFEKAALYFLNSRLKMHLGVLDATTDEHFRQGMQRDLKQLYSRAFITLEQYNYLAAEIDRGYILGVCYLTA